MLARKLASRSYSTGAGGNSNFDVLKFISRIETMYDAQQQKQPLSSSIEFKRQTSKNDADRPKRPAQNQSNGKGQRNAQNRGNNNNNINNNNSSGRPQRTGQQQQQRQRAPRTESQPSPGLNTKNIRLQGLGSDIDSALETTPGQQKSALKKTFGRPQGQQRSGGFSRSQSNGFTRPNNGFTRPNNGFRARATVGASSKKNNFSKNGNNSSKSKTNARRSRNSKSDAPTFVHSNLSPEEGLSIINRLIHDPAVKTSFALVHSLDSVALTEDLDSNSLTKEAALWSTLKKLPSTASQEEVKSALNTTFKGLSPNTLSHKNVNIGSASFINAANSNFGIPLELKKALYQVTLGEAPVSSAVQK